MGKSYSGTVGREVASITMTMGIKLKYSELLRKSIENFSLNEDEFCLLSDDPAFKVSGENNKIFLKDNSCKDPNSEKSITATGR